MKTDQTISTKALIGAMMISGACIVRSFAVRGMFDSFGVLMMRVGLLCALACLYYYGARYWLAEVKPPVKKKSVALWLSILGGMFGLDRLYLGDKRSPALKFLTFGGLGLWWICDIIMIASGLLRPLDATGYDTDTPAQQAQTAQRAQPAAAQPTRAAQAHAANAAKRKRDPIKTLNDLKELYEKGIISGDEYARKRDEYVKQL